MFLHLRQLICIALGLLAAALPLQAAASGGILGKSPKEIVQILGKPLERTEESTGTDGGILFENRDHKILVEFRDFKAVVARVMGKDVRTNIMDASTLLATISGTSDWVTKESSINVQRWESRDGRFNAELLSIRGELIVVSKPWQEIMKASSTLEGLMNPPATAAAAPISEEAKKKAEALRKRMEKAIKNGPQSQ